ncbi:MAG: hypothetical protein IJP45_01780 [Paludibacteraceae bacterium]|nr:hypothetical protein [Paludibacteraceae bacterium]
MNDTYSAARRFPKQHRVLHMLGCAGRQMKRQTSFAGVFLYVASCERLPQHRAAGHRGGVQLSAHKLQVFFDRLLKI